MRLECEKKKNLYKLKKNPIYLINIVHNFEFTWRFPITLYIFQSKKETILKMSSRRSNKSNNYLFLKSF